ncbi:MAG TPA: hypothetical protein VLD59_09450 [Steroidobacteraceae bacterium]|nr:hypothetical protein [Steroidobacteraceae bacterium]
MVDLQVRKLMIPQLLLVGAAAIGNPAIPQEQSVVQLTSTGARNRTGAWAPDGTSIVFGSNRNGTWQLWLMQPDGSDALQLTAQPQAVGGPTWSADGTEVWFEAGFRIVRLVLSSLETFPLDVEHAKAFRPVPSADGVRLLFDVSAGDNHDIWVRDLRERRGRRLTADPGYESDARWSPDGTRIVFHSDRGEARFHTQVFSMLPDGSDVRQLTSGPSKNGYPTWSPNGQCIVYTSEIDGNRDLWLMDRSGSNKRRLTFHRGFDGDPSWKPTGGSILFSTSRWGGEELAVLALSAADVQTCEA